MLVDEYGLVGFSQEEIVEYLKINPNFDLNGIYLIDGKSYKNAKKQTLIDVPNIMIWDERDHDIPMEQYHKELQKFWLMPTEYEILDIKQYILDKCKSSEEINRVNMELKLYEKFNLINLLRYLKYIKDIADKNNIVWGVGRGSSVSSYCLFLMKIHRVNSLLYDLDVTEFLRD